MEIGINVNPKQLINKLTRVKIVSPKTNVSTVCNNVDRASSFAHFFFDFLFSSLK